MISNKAITIALGALLSGGILMAQSGDPGQAAATNPNSQMTAGPRRKADPAREAKHLGKQLRLSQDQVAQIQPILADRDQQMQTLRADSTLSQQDRRTKFQTIRQDSKTKIEALLNDQQKQQFEQMQAQRRGHRQEGAPQAQ